MGLMPSVHTAPYKKNSHGDGGIKAERAEKAAYSFLEFRVLDHALGHLLELAAGDVAHALSHGFGGTRNRIGHVEVGNELVERQCRKMTNFLCSFGATHAAGDIASISAKCGAALLMRARSCSSESYGSLWLSASDNARITAQSSLACPGGNTARLVRCTRPSRLT